MSQLPALRRPTAAHRSSLCHPCSAVPVRGAVLVRRQRGPMKQQQLLLAKAWNFFAGASGVVLFPYLNLYLAQRGLSPGQIGLLAALRTWGSAPVSLAATAAADRLRLHKQLLVAACMASVALRSSLPLVQDTWALFGVLLAADLLGAPVGPLSDAAVISNCNEAAGESYGKQRQWGSIGWGLCSLPAGWLIEHTGLTSAFVGYAVASLPLLAITARMRYNYSHAASTAHTQDGQQQQRQSALDDTTSSSSSGSSMQLRQLLLQAPVALFLWRCMLLGVGMGVMGNFEFMWLKQLGAPEVLMGVAIMVSITTEIPAFKFQGQALRTASPEALMNLALAATTLRLGLYGLLPLAPSVWCVLPIELLHGASFALGWGAATAGSSRLAPPHLAATMQGLWQATYGGIGAGLGGLLGGLLLDRQGGQGLFFTAAAAVAAGGLAAAGVGLMMQRAGVDARPKAE